MDSVNQFLGNTILSVGIEARGNFTDKDDLDFFFSKVNETDAKFVQTGQRCLESDGAFLKYMGTVSSLPYGVIIIFTSFFLRQLLSEIWSFCRIFLKVQENR